MIPPLPNIDNYQVSAENGFLPNEAPLDRLPDPYYRLWEDIVSRLHHLILSKTIRQAVDCLPVLSTYRLRSDSEWRRAYVVLGFISNAYIWGLEKAEDRLPRCVSIPFLEISQHLEVPPVVTYAGVCLWNFRPIYPAGPIDMMENLESLCTFTGLMDESWFYLLSVAIEARGAPTIPLMIEAMRAARRDDCLTVIDCLILFAGRIIDLRELLGRITEHCSPHAFYFRIRPFLAGSKNMAEAGLPNGVLFEDGSGQETYRQYAGGSNAQSSLIQFFDIVLGIEHRPTGVKMDASAEKLPGTAPPSRHNFLEEMRSYMPGPHRRFLEHLMTAANIRDYVEGNRDNLELSAAYDECLRALSCFRDKHLQIVSRYIVIMSQESKRKAAAAAAAADVANKAVVTTTHHRDSSFLLQTNTTTKLLGLAKGDAARKGLKGTGGTQLIPFLKQSRDETMEPALASWSKECSSFESFRGRSRSNTPTTTPGATPRCNSPVKGFAVRSCKVNDFEDIPAARVMGVGMAGVWDVGVDIGGICNY